MIEEWKEIEGYKGTYQISNFGKVRSTGRTVYSDKRYFKLSRSFYLKPKLLSLFTDKLGYQAIKLYKDGKYKRELVHRLVAKAFILNPDNKPFINHIDSNPSNNIISNLEWCTHKENMQHSVIMGNKCGHTKLYLGEEYLKILKLVKNLREQKISYKDISSRTGFSASSIYRIINYGHNRLKRKIR